jgi:Stress responsive A/B Barrel Domain
VAAHVEDSPHGDDSHLPGALRPAREAPVIRNVVVGRLRPAENPAQEAAHAALLQEGLAGIAALSLPGMLANNVGSDLALRDGGWSFAITNDWQDADAYRAYDADEEHNRLRREIFAKICQDIARVQIQIP